MCDPRSVNQSSWKICWNQSASLLILETAANSCSVSPASDLGRCRCTSLPLCSEKRKTLLQLQICSELLVKRSCSCSSGVRYVGWTDRVPLALYLCASVGKRTWQRRKIPADSKPCAHKQHLHICVFSPTVFVLVLTFTVSCLFNRAQAARISLWSFSCSLFVGIPPPDTLVTWN